MGRRGSTPRVRPMGTVRRAGLPALTAGSPRVQRMAARCGPCARSLTLARERVGVPEHEGATERPGLSCRGRAGRSLREEPTMAYIIGHYRVFSYSAWRRRVDERK